MQQRDKAIDIAKAIGILLMILGHCEEIPYMPYRHFIFTFHIPLFFIISGYLYKSKDIRYSLIKDAKHFMIPYLATCMAVIALTFLYATINNNYEYVQYYIVATLLGSGSKHSCLFFSQVPNIGAIWFFPALLVCKNVYNCMAKYEIKTRLLYSSIIFLCATLIGRYLLFLPFSILSGLSAIIFFAIGDLFKKPFDIKSWHWLLGIACWFISFHYSHLYIVQPKVDLYFIDVIGATTASIIVYLISKKLKETVFSNLLSWIGRYTMYILCFHLIDLKTSISLFLTHGDNFITIIVRIVFPIVASLCFIKIKQGCEKVAPPRLK